MTRRGWTALAVIMVVGLAIVAAGAAQAPQAAQAAPEQLTCQWTNIGNSSKQIFHTASAYDTDANMMYVYSGVDDQYAPTNAAEAGDLSGTSFRATWRSVASSQATKRVGVSGAYRAKGADSDDSGAYFVGGMTDPNKGNGTDIVEAYMTKAGDWVTIDADGFDARSFAAAAYDPVHDAIWVVGGVGNCALPDVIGGGNCPARAISTQYLTWDAAGMATWNTLPNGNQSYYAHAMVYDAPRSRMLIFGGTDNITRGNGDVLVLDLSDPDPSKATISQLSTTGTGPSTYFGGAVFFADQDWLVAYGGVQRDFMQSTEATETKTYGLDLAQTPAAWVNLNPAGSPGTRVGGTMEYAPNHKGAVFALGRDKSDGDPQTIEKIQRTSYGLTCEVQVVTPTTPPVATTAVPTSGTPGTVVPPTVPPATPKPGQSVCSYVQIRVPQAVVNDALANPQNYAGYGMRCNPNVPASPWNIERTTLALQNPKALFHPLFNTVIWKCGCP
jgi:hypothetical protein